MKKRVEKIKIPSFKLWGKVLGLILSIIILLWIVKLVFIGSKSFYCLQDDNCVTVWKKTNGEAYFIFEEYKKNSVPKKNYIKTTYNNSVTILFDNASNYDFIIHNNYGEKLSIDSSNYSIKYFPYDEFDDFVEKYYNKNNKVKKGIKYLQIDIAENLVILNGEKIE